MLFKKLYVLIGIVYEENKGRETKRSTLTELLTSEDGTSTSRVIEDPWKGET